MARGATSFSVSDSPLPDLTPSTPSMPHVLSLTRRLSPFPQAANFVTSSLVEEPLPTTIPSADIGVLDVIPSVTGPPTITELVEEYMEDLLIREFCPILLDEDI